jgi:Family of unknown function (DUF5947)
VSSDAKSDRPGLIALASLRRFARPRAARERCELCDAGLAGEHAHLIELASRRLLCACEACAILFDRQGAAKYRSVPRRVRFLPDFHLPDAAWESLHLPIDLAFFLHSTPMGRVIALYPSPGGATESLVPLDAWQTLTEDNPILRDLQPDVEALLVNRVGEARECYRAGIDECYKLVGLIRTHWRGLSGGTAVWDEIGRFFVGLKARSSSQGGGAHA